MKDRLRSLAYRLSFAASLFSACNTTKTNPDERISHLPPNGTFANIVQLPINKTDAEEETNYTKFLNSYKLADQQAQTLLQNEKLHSIVGEGVPYEEMLPMRIKESRLISDATSRTGATGYGQLQKQTIDDVT